MLSLFSNFHFEVADAPLRNERDYVELIKMKQKEVFEIDIVF
jgi:hypothetical protein